MSKDQEWLKIKKLISDVDWTYAPSTDNPLHKLIKEVIPELYLINHKLRKEVNDSHMFLYSSDNRIEKQNFEIHLLKDTLKTIISRSKCEWTRDFAQRELDVALTYETE